VADVMAVVAMMRTVGGGMDFGIGVAELPAARQDFSRMRTSESWRRVEERDGGKAAAGSCLEARAAV